MGRGCVVARARLTGMALRHGVAGAVCVGRLGWLPGAEWGDVASGWWMAARGAPDARVWARVVVGRGEGLVAREGPAGSARPGRSSACPSVHALIA